MTSQRPGCCAGQKLQESLGKLPSSRRVGCLWVGAFSSLKTTPQRHRLILLRLLAAFDRLIFCLRNACFALFGSASYPTQVKPITKHTRSSLQPLFCGRLDLLLATTTRIMPFRGAQVFEHLYSVHPRGMDGDGATHQLASWAQNLLFQDIRRYL